jgi:hypothetical protein
VSLVQGNLVIPHPTGSAADEGTLPPYAQNTEQVDRNCSPHAPQLLSFIGSFPGFNEVGTIGRSQKSTCHPKNQTKRLKKLKKVKINSVKVHIQNSLIHF